MDNNLKIFLAVAAAVGGVVTLFNYIEGKEHRKTLRRVALLEEQIKKHQLEKLKSVS